MSKVKKVFRLVKKYGLRTTFGVVKEKLSHRPSVQKKKIVALINSSMKEGKLEKERSHTFEYEPTISILVPLYNTDSGMLKSVIESVVSQTYSKWQLCICDGSDRLADVTEDICKSFLEDSRIVYKKLPDNLGISQNTNACAKLATGEYLALLDHDDVLHPSALYSVVEGLNQDKADFIYTDEVTFKGEVSNVLTANFKPDYAPDTLRANNYVCHFTVFARKLFDKVGGFRREYDGSQDHDLFLRMAAVAQNIKHIPEILYFWRAHENSVVEDVTAKKYAVDAGKKAVKDYLQTIGLNCEVSSTEVYPTIYKIDYPLPAKAKISIIIPNKNNYQMLKRCVDSIRKSTYDNYEIIIVENNSNEPELFEYYKELKVVTHNIQFNYSRLNNLAAKEALGEYLLFLNNDTEVINEEWLTEMLMFAARKDVGAVGARLFYPNNTLQHSYLITGLGEHGVAVHAGLGLAAEDYGYLDRIGFNQNVNAVTGACLMVAADKFHRVGGFDESLPVAYNDVDLCLKLRKEGFLNVYTPFAKLYHYESLTRGRDTDEELQKAADYMKDKWGTDLVDPYYNANFSTRKQYVLK